MIDAIWQAMWEPRTVANAIVFGLLFNVYWLVLCLDMRKGIRVTR